MEDWEKNPNKYLTDAQGNYILKKDGTPQKNVVDQKILSYQTLEQRYMLRRL